MKLRVLPSKSLPVDQREPEPYVGAEPVVDKAPPDEAFAPPPAADVSENRPPDGRPPPERTSSPERPLAIFVTHGMGQQVKFSTLDLVVQGLERALRRRSVFQRGAAEADVDARTVQLGEIRTERIEMHIPPEDGGAPPLCVHIYEGYWAPLTEGRVTLRDVMRFLYRGAANGLKKGIGQPLERYMFEHPALHRVDGAAFAGLLLTTLVLGALVLLNAVIAAVVLDTGFDVLANAAVTEGGLVARALTRIVFWYLVVTVSFGAALLAASATARYARGAPGPGRRVVLGSLWYLGFPIWVVATLGAGVLTLAVLLSTVLPDGLVLGGWVWLPPILVVAAGAAAVFSIGHGDRALRRYREGEGKIAVSLLPRGLTTAFAVLLVGAAIAYLALVILRLVQWGVPEGLAAGEASGMGQPWFRYAVWAALFAVSAAIRNVIVQYFGDVAAYVSPHTLDRFAELRTAIRTAVAQTLNGIYHHVEDGRYVYESVAVVGHSLGSVVAYDALNRALNDDERAAPGEGARVRERTRLLLTFGSPLDKTAYIFRGQNQSLSLVREALANAVQPLIRDAGVRTFPWVNVHSPRDILGSALDLYDAPLQKQCQRSALAKKAAQRPAKAHDRRTTTPLRAELDDLRAVVETDECPTHYCVHDIEDPGARIPLIAHNEHWRTHAVFDVLFEAMIAPAWAHRAAPKGELRSETPQA